MWISVKEYLKYFKWFYLVLGILALLLILLTAGQAGIAKAIGYERTNTECLTAERVFDYADVLTDKEEEKLRRLIARREKQTGCDIVLVTLNETLEDYVRELGWNVSYDKFVMVFAENFYEQNKFGFDKPNGDGVLLVDNWYREADGKIYTWLCTTGKAYDAYYEEDIDHLLDNVYRYVETNPYRAYKTYVNTFYHDMAGTGVFRIYVPGYVPWVVGILSAFLFVLYNWKSKKGSKTVTATTYVPGKQPVFRVHEDRFLRKSVVTHRIQSSSGGGGHSGGGRSHGGGGHGHGGGGHSR